MFAKRSLESSVDRNAARACHRSLHATLGASHQYHSHETAPHCISNTLLHGRKKTFGVVFVVCLFVWMAGS